METLYSDSIAKRNLINTSTEIHPSLIEPTPKGGIGLVLSGGGAKGLYHVGIIKALEENEIAIDYIAGASMGAIVGAMYATGWSPERMWKFFLTDSVSHWLSGKIPDKYRGYYRRFEPSSEMVGINLQVDTTSKKNTFQLPTNLIQPDLIDLAFIEMLGPASSTANGNFDSLMVPFRCVASDMYKKELVTFSNGSLPFAVRSSMTIPLVFKPLEMDSTLLYDGGVMNNFPWKSLEKDFSPSNYIGGVCTDNFDNPISSDILGQIMVMITRNTDYNLPDTTTDVLVNRLMKEIGTLDYSKAATVMQYGYDDAMAKMDEIKSKIKARTTKATMEARRNDFLGRTAELTFDTIVISGLSHSQELYVRRHLRLHQQANFTFDYFYDKYLRVISAGLFSGGFPSLKYDPLTGYYQLHIKMATKKSMRLSLGGNISSTSLNQGYVAFNYRHTTSVASVFGIQGHFGMFHNGIKLGGHHDFYTSFPFYVDYNFAYGNYRYNGSNMESYYKNKDWRYNDHKNLSFSTSISIPILVNSAFRAKLSMGENNFKYFESIHTSADISARSKVGYLSLLAEIETSTINFPQYANHGTYQNLSIRYIASQESYTPSSIVNKDPLSPNSQGWFEMRYSREQYIPIAKWFTLGYLFDAVVSTHPDFENWLITRITSPKFEPTPQMQTQFMSEFSSASYIGVGIMPTFNLLKDRSLYLKMYAYAFIPQDLILLNNTWYAPTFKRFGEFTEFIFGGSLVYQTPIGPASLTLAKYTTGPENWSFQFNFGYTLFRNIKF